MKFRNHFVTNSSSSSFVAVLSLEFADGKKAELVYDRDFFEDLEIRLSFGDRCVYAEEGDIPHHLDETELGIGPEMLDLKRLLNADSAQKLIENLDTALYLPAAPEGEEDEEDYDWLSPRAKALLEQKEMVRSAYRAELEQNLHAVSDLRKAGIRITADGRRFRVDDCFLDVLYGEAAAKQIDAIVSEGDGEADILPKLRELDCLSGLEDSSLRQILRFLKEYGSQPYSYEIVQTLENDGVISLQIQEPDF